MTIPDIVATEAALIPPQLSGLDHVSLTVTDVEASEAWYKRVLGVERILVEHHEGGYVVVLNRPGTPLIIGIHHHEDNEAEVFAEKRTGLDHLALRVPDRASLDAWAEHLDRLGVQRSEITDVTEPIPFSLKTFRDLDNIQLELTFQ